MLTLGSLFDGIGGFPLAGAMCGIKTLWSSEIEPFPLKVTAARFPDVKQLGSVLDINGAEIDPVDIITFGSPCQDLSVAGLRKGIHAGERSSLFFEAIRIIKEMREHDRATGRADVDLRPRFAVWENVHGAFSSNKGEDFRAVLQAFASVCEDGLDIPGPPRGKWSHAGGMAGNGWSVAWRIYDAQYWGVPQRRKRIYLVADFAGERAHEILFERESVPGDPAQSGEAGEGTAADAEGSVGGSDSVRCLNPWNCQSKRQHDINGAYSTLQAYSGGGGRCEGIVYAIDSTITTGGNCTAQGSCVYEDICPTEKACHAHAVCYGVDCRNAKLDVEKTHALQAKASGGQSLNCTPSVCYRACGFGGMTEGVGTLRANGGDAGGVLKASSLSVFDARGNGDGMVAPTTTGDHENRVTDYTTIVVEKHE